VLTLGPKSFSSRWADRPAGAIQVGLRIASADEQLVASTEAVARTDRLLPTRTPQDRQWAATYEVCWIHYLLGMVLTSPADVNAPLWAAQDGSLLLCEKEPHEPGDSVLVSMRFSDSGIARLWDEYDALVISENVIWPEAGTEEVRKLGESLASGAFFAGLDKAAAEGNADAHHVGRQLRRLLHYVVHLRTNGRGRATRPA
jgi:hypothetical protein